METTDLHRETPPDAGASEAVPTEGGTPAGASALRPSTRVYGYDGSFDGLLSLVFEAYRRRERPARVVADGAPFAGTLFGDVLVVPTDTAHAARVRDGLARRVTSAGVDALYHAFLSEADGIEDALVALVEAIFARGGTVVDDLRFGPSLAAARMAARVRTEVHRMHAFVRFERRAGDLYVARICPDHHVLPLLAPHFEGRYGAQRWAILDDRRGLALVHEPGQPLVVALADAFDALPREADEATFQRMWRRYIVSVTIPERRNLRLQRRHLPRRYWPYLTEWTPDPAE